MRRALRAWLILAVTALMMLPAPALADDCGTLTDCFNQLSTALWVIAAVALVGAVIVAFPYLVGGLGLGGLAAAGAGGGTVVVGGAVALPAAVASALTISAGAATAAALTDLVLMAKDSRKSGKEKASDLPSWVRGQRPRSGEAPRTAARRLLDEKYGLDNWPRGAGTEYSAIKKFFERLIGRRS